MTTSNDKALFNRNKLVLLALSLATVSASHASFAASKSASIQLSAMVPTQCALQNIVAIPTQQGSQVTITTGCNAQSYRVALDTGNNFQVTSVRSTDPKVSSIRAFASTLQVNANRPGLHELVVNFDGDVTELPGFRVGLTAN